MLTQGSKKHTDRKINIVGIDGHELTGLDVVTGAALFDTQKAPAIRIFHEYAHLGKGRSIHAAGHMDITWMLPFWIMVLHLHFLMKSTKKLMIHCFGTQFL